MSDPSCALPLSEVLLALPEFNVLDVDLDHEGAELVVTVELPRGVQACHRCGVIARHQVHARRRHHLRHLPVAGRACRIVWHKRLLLCDSGCGTFVERTPSIAPGAVWTRPAARAAVAMSRDNVPVERIRREFGVAWATVMAAIISAASALPAIDPVRVGIDETLKVSGRLLTRRRVYLTGLVCLDSGRVVAVDVGRTRTVAEDLLRAHAPNATLVACDLYSGFRSAAAVLEAAVVVADAFHVVKLALAALDAVRRRRQQQIHGHRGHKNDLLYRKRRVLLVARERLTDDQLDRLHQQLHVEDTDDEVGSAWHAAHLARQVVHAIDPRTCHEKLVELFWWAATVDIPEITKLAATLDDWTSEIVAAVRHRASNAMTESANVKIKNIRRAARGFRNDDNYQARILLHAGQARSVPSTPSMRPYTVTLAA